MLNERQKWLYSFLQTTSTIDSDKYIDKEFILSHDTNFYYSKDKNEQTHDICPTILKDINIINEDLETKGIIIAQNGKYRFANNEEEVLTALKKLYFKPALTKLKKYSRTLKKLKNDKQIVFELNNNCLDIKSLSSIDAFIDYGEKLESN